MRSNRINIWTCLVTICLACFCISSCGTADVSEAPAAEQPVSIATLGFVPDFSYEYSEQIPHIITDRVGYSPTGKKVAYIKGNDLEKGYSIITSTGAETVYEGKLKKISEDGAKEGLYIGDFSDFSRHGSFRIYQENVGYSYIFNIDDVSYNSVFNEAYNTIVRSEYSDTEALIYTLGNLLVTAQIYPNAYCNNGFIKGGIELLMTQQNPRTGAVYAELQDADTLSLIEEEMNDPAAATVDTDSMTSVSATAAYAGLLAQFYTAYLQDDPELANVSLREAVRAYAYAEKNATEEDAERMIYAACELYKATGQYKYRNAIETYDALKSNRLRKKDTDPYNYDFLSDVAYLSTNFRTDYYRCETLMNKYSDAAGKISMSADRAHFYVQSDIDSMGKDDMLDNMMLLGLVGYVLSGREYSSIESNYLHYLFGLNRDMVNYYSEPIGEGETPLSLDAVRLSKLIFVLCGENGGAI